MPRRHVRSIDAGCVVLTIRHAAMTNPRVTSDTARLQQMNMLLRAALALPPQEREDWLLGLPPEYAALVPLLRALLRRASAQNDAFMQRPAASIG